MRRSLLLIGLLLVFVGMAQPAVVVSTQPAGKYVFQSASRFGLQVEVWQGGVLLYQTLDRVRGEARLQFESGAAGAGELVFKMLSGPAAGSPEVLSVERAAGGDSTTVQADRPLTGETDVLGRSAVRLGARVTSASWRSLAGALEEGRAYELGRLELADGTTVRVTITIAPSAYAAH